MSSLLPISKLTPFAGSKLKIACVGDSITYGCRVEDRENKSYPARLQKKLGKGYEVGNFGKNGAYALTEDSPFNKKSRELSYKQTAEYSASIAFCPDVVVIMLGTNDVRNLTEMGAPEAFKDSYSDLINDYLSLPSVQRVYVATTMRHVNDWLICDVTDGLVQGMETEVADSLGLPVIDVYGYTRDYYDLMLHTTHDRVHPEDETCAVIADAVYAGLMNLTLTKPEVPEAKGTVLYVSSAGSFDNDGLTPDSPIGNLAYAAGLLRKTGGTVVICGEYTQAYYLFMPATSRPIKITSRIGDRDFRSDGAVLKFLSYMNLCGDYVFDDLDVLIGKDNLLLFCRYHNATFGKGLNIKLDAGVVRYPVLVAGYQALPVCYPLGICSFSGKCAIRIEGGTWAYLRGGNRRFPGTAVCEVTKEAEIDITVDGGRFADNGDTYVFSATGMNSTSGTVNLTIGGGIFEGPVYAVGMADPQPERIAEMSGSVNVSVRGGQFARGGPLQGPQNSSVEVKGKINIT